MPQLQNNNRTSIKSNQGNAPRNGSYINEAKVAEYKNIQKNSTTILRGIADFGVQAGEKLQEIETKKQQMDMENKFNDYTRDFSNRTKLYQTEYAKNPDQKLTDQYENDIKNMTESYEGQIPFAFKNNFLERTNILQKNTNLDFFRKITEINYQNEKFINNLNDSLESINTNSYLGNQQAINYEIANLPLKKDN